APASAATPPKGEAFVAPEPPTEAQVAPEPSGLSPTDLPLAADDEAPISKTQRKPASPSGRARTPSAVSGANGVTAPPGPAATGASREPAPKSGSSLDSITKRNPYR